MGKSGCSLHRRRQRRLFPERLDSLRILGKRFDRLGGYSQTPNRPRWFFRPDSLQSCHIRCADFRQPGGNLTISGGAIQSAIGNIDINIGGDISLLAGGAQAYVGAIRTTGRPAGTSTSLRSQYWNYYGGGNIALDVGGSVNTATRTNSWDVANTYTPSGGNTLYYWSASYARQGKYDTTEGIAAMGGGSISIYAGGS